MSFNGSTTIITNGYPIITRQFIFDIFTEVFKSDLSKCFNDHFTILLTSIDVNVCKHYNSLKWKSIYLNNHRDIKWPERKGTVLLIILRPRTDIWNHTVYCIQYTVYYNHTRSYYICFYEYHLLSPIKSLTEFVCAAEQHSKYIKFISLWFHSGWNFQF